MSIGEHMLPLVSAWVSNTPTETRKLWIQSHVATQEGMRLARAQCMCWAILAQSLNHGVGMSGSTFGSSLGLVRPVVACVCSRERAEE